MTESPWSTTNGSASSPVDRFLSLYWSDVDAGRKRSLKEYLEQCPGDDLAVADEFVQCERPEAEKSTILDRYRIVGSLSSGAQGEVYAAIDHQIGRRVAVKKLHAKPFADPSAQKRFSREARTLGQLEHPNICRIYDVVEDDGRIVVVMELIEGESLACRIHRERKAESAVRDTNSSTPRTDDSGRATRSKLSSSFAAASDPRTIIELFRKIAAAMQVAHDLKIVHRDLKPANIMVKHSGEPMIVDFGLAIVLDESRSAQVAQGGTHGYMSPEQLTATFPHAIDARSDIFSLGVMLYEALTLEHPFGGATDAARDAATLNVEPRPPSSIRPQLSRDVDAVVQCAMSKELSRRYRTAAELAKDLKRLLDGEPTAARPIGFFGRWARWSRRQPTKAVLGAVLIVGVPTFASLLTAYLNDRPRVIEAERAEAIRIREGLIAKALVFQAQEQIAEAAAIYERIAADGPIPVEVACFHARTKLAQGDANGALSLLDAIDSSAARGPGPILTRAKTLRALGREDEARKITNSVPNPRTSLDFILMAMNEYAIAQEHYGESTYRNHVPDTARRYCRTAMFLTPQPRLYYTIVYAMCIVHSGDREEAEATAHALRENWPNQSTARFWAAALLAEFADPSIDAAIAEDYRTAIRLDPESSAAWTNLAVILIRLGRLEDAEKELREAEKALPLAPDIKCSFGILLMRRNRIDEAETKFREALHISPKHARTLVNLASLQIDRGRVDEGVASAQRAVDAAPRDQAIRSSFASILRKAGRPKDAAVELRHILLSEEEFAPLHNELGVCLADLGEYEESLKEQNRAIELDPCVAAYYDCAGVVLFKLGRSEDALSALRRAIEIDPNYISAWRNLGAVKLAMERWVEALEAFQVVLESEPNDRVSLSGIATAQLRLGKYEEAVVSYRRCLEFAPSSLPLHRCLADSLKNSGRPSEAADVLVRASGLWPDDAPLRREVAVMLMAAGRFDEAVDACEAAIQLSPSDGRLHDLLGLIFLKQNKLERAVTELREAVKLDPKKPTTRTRLSIALRQSGRIDDAIAEGLEAVRLAPEIIDGHTELSATFSIAGRAHDSLLHARKSVELAPDGAWGHRVLVTALAAQEQYEEAIRHFESLGAERMAEVASTQDLRDTISECRRSLERCKNLQQRIDRYINEGRLPETSEELVELAREAERSGRFDIAANWYATALRANARAGSDVGARHRFRAARATLLMIDRTQDTQEKSEMSARAVAWIADDIRMIVDCFEDGNAPSSSVRRMVDSYLNDPLFAFLHEEKSDGIPVESVRRILKARAMLKELLSEL